MRNVSLAHPVNKLILIILLFLALIIGVFVYYNRRINDIEYKLNQTSGQPGVKILKEYKA
jgi:hypothetical protein